MIEFLNKYGAFIGMVLFVLLIIFLFKKLRKDKLPYTRKPLLSQNELKFYTKLRPIADYYELCILTKIRMADIVEVQKGTEHDEFYKYFNKIKSKHVDFALAYYEDLEIAMLIELDDRSHAQKARIERDNFIDAVYNKVGIAVIHTYGNDMDLLKKEVGKILDEINQ